MSQFCHDFAVIKSRLGNYLTLKIEWCEEALRSALHHKMAEAHEIVNVENEYFPTKAS